MATRVVKNIIAAIKFRLVQNCNASTAQVIETSVTVNESTIQDYDRPDDHAPPTYHSWVQTFDNPS